MSALSFAQVDRLTGFQLGIFDVGCPLCGPGRRDPRNRTRKVLRIYRRQPDFAGFKCARCGIEGSVSNVAHSQRHRRTSVETHRVDPTVDAALREDERTEIARRMDAARRIWREARRYDMDRVDAYLASRCLARPLTGHIRFHTGVRHKETGREWPAMVWLITDGVTGKPLGVHVTFLDDTGVGKAPITPAKKTFGLIRGGVIRLTPAPPADSGEPLILAEGLETALSALSAGYAYAWAAISSGNMKVIDLPEDVQTVIVIADMDDDGGTAAARVLAQRLSRQGRNVRIAQPPPGLDLNDLLIGKAAEEVAA
jgi:hypothetical protein